MRTMGVEEEFLLVGADGTPVAVAGAVLQGAERAEGPDDDRPGGELEAELKQQQIETGTHPCADLDDLAREVRLGRERAQQAAGGSGARIVALATSPLAVASTVSPNPRYLEMTRRFGLTAREQLTCGCHVHVGVADDEEGVAVLDRIGPWLAPLLALSGNSPFWQGQDSGYDSYRAQVWNRWPTAGPTGPFGSAEEYHRTLAELIATGTVLDHGMVYFDARLSARYPTVEIRVGDVCLDPQDAVLLAALARGLVETAAREAAAGGAPSGVRVETLRAAGWRASRSGVADMLVSPLTLEPVPARRALDELVGHVGAALGEAGDLEQVTTALDELLDRGNGAAAQRTWFRETGDLAQVIERATTATLG